MMESNKTSRTESRRNLLKKIGAGSAIVWTAPVITSASPVSGLSSVCNGVDWNCGDPFTECAEPGPPIGICICDVDVEGNIQCWNDISCASSPACATSADCPPGWRCTTQCCGQTCTPPCGTVPAVPGEGPRASGLG